ncbi:hypothetical protein [Kitasatospora sp. NPDC093558]|uniref:hypothetical protein n=1 Tax=Kitasatospora sp. NPDC093558 TaxID=3155201 RepID=UPI003420881C
MLCALVPLLTAGVLGPVPSLVLALRRRRPYDIAGAVVYCMLLLTMVVCAGVAGDDKASAANAVGEVALGLLWLTPTLHFLVMDRRSLWTTPPPAVPYLPPPVTPYGATMPGHAAPPPADDLRELGELLRRQAREGRS